jgi:3-oxoacyl-[acyl-carrier-protein] synthase-3
VNIKIRDIAYYHPINKVSNEYFINQFDEKDIDIRGLLNTTGREVRYISDNPEENTLTMSIEATKEVLRKTNLTGQDLDLVVAVSDSPEYLTPTNAIRIHNAINGNNF